MALEKLQQRQCSPGRAVVAKSTGHQQHLAGPTAPEVRMRCPSRAAVGDSAGEGVELAHLVPPAASPWGDNGELGQDDGPMDGSGYLLGILNTQITLQSPFGVFLKKLFLFLLS